MNFVYLTAQSVIMAVFLSFSTEINGYEIDDTHNEDVHDSDDSGDDHYSNENNLHSDAASQLFSSFSKEDVKNHLKDIIRGFSDKGFEDCDKDKDNFLDVSEVECFVTDKMGYSIKGSHEYVVNQYDTDQNNKLDSDEIWNIVEDKDPAIFEILPATVQKNMLLMHGVEEEHLQMEEPEATGDDVFIKD